MSKQSEKQAGKGKGPEKGRNWKNWSKGWDYWKKQEKKKKVS